MKLQLNAADSGYPPDLIWPNPGKSRTKAQRDPHFVHKNFRPREKAKFLN
jgi:hypothetical protein